MRDADLPRCGNGGPTPGSGKRATTATPARVTAARATAAIERDFDCPRPGMACIYQVRCGDGMLGGIEQCDPPAVGAGCGATCKLEPGFVCDAPPVVPDPTQPAALSSHRLRRRSKEGSEACDDGDVVDGDGCSGSCSFEPDCSSGNCASACGDAVKLAPEACDDGNSQDGDGCSRDCQLETGFSCTDAAAEPARAAQPARDLPRLHQRADRRRDPPSRLRELRRHGDHASCWCRPTLDAAGKPVGRRAMHAGRRHRGVSLRSAAVDGGEFRRVVSRRAPAPTSTIPGTLLLRAAGQRIIRLRLRQPRLLSRSTIRGGSPPARETIAIADPIINDGRPHNFGFTTEIRYFFQYRGGESPAFSGSGGVWIFVNRRLALDLGGLHTRTERTLAVDQSAAALGLTIGALYEVVLFHAERHSTGSNFKLTLTGFSPTSSTCTSACGDGVLAATEECDDGNRVGGDGCSSDCRHEIIVDYPGDVHRPRAGRSLTGPEHLYSLAAWPSRPMPRP